MGLLSRANEAFWGLLDPWLFLTISARFLPQTIKHIFGTLPFPRALGTLLSPSRFREAWFGQFWAVAGPGVRENAAARVLPLLDGRTSGGKITEVPAGPGVGGTVIEIGPGSGLWVSLFADAHVYENPDADVRVRRKRKGTARSEITRVYGVEPNAAHHAALRASVAAAGLQGVYEIVPVGIEDLSSGGGSEGKEKKKWDGNIEPGSVDCIVSILCLCSIPDPEQHVRELYHLLRPGGRWYLYEHVRCEYSWYMRLYQRFLNLVWPHFIGGCQLCRPTGQTLRNAGPWSSIDIGQPPPVEWYHTLPHILGVFTK